MLNPSKPQSWRDVLPVHPAAKLFPLMSEEELRELARDIKKHTLRERPVFYADPELGICVLDGRNRLDALELIGREVVNADGQLLQSSSFSIIKGGRTFDPVAFVLSKNLHRRHLTPEQKRELIARLIKQTPNKSDRQIAEQTKTSPTTVGKIRKNSEATGDVSKLDARTDTKGRKQPSTKPKKPAKATSSAKSDPIGSPSVRNSELPATSVPRLSATAHFLVNGISRQLKEAEGKLSEHDRAQLFAEIRALVDPDDIVGEVVRLVGKMTVSQRRGLFARLLKEGLGLACAAEHEAATNPIPDDLSTPIGLDQLAERL